MLPCTQQQLLRVRAMSHRSAGPRDYGMQLWLAFRSVVSHRSKRECNEEAHPVAVAVEPQMLNSCVVDNVVAVVLAAPPEPAATIANAASGRGTLNFPLLLR